MQYTKIKSIKPLGQKQTYDLTVKHHDHTFFCQGISVSNSYNHALSYSMISYQCAYLFTYYQDDWCSAYLDTETGKSTDVKQKSILNVQKLGYDILLPDINLSSDKWRILDNKKLMAPFTMIKGMGDKSIEQITKNQPFHTIEDFLFNDNILYRSLNKKKIKDLALSGVLDSLKDDRFLTKKHFVDCIESKTDKKVNKQNFSDIIYYGEITKKQIDLFANDDQKTKIDTYDEFSRQELIVHKLDILGYYDMKMILNDKRTKFLNSNDIKNITNYTKEDNTVWFIPIEKTAKISKSGKKHYVEVIAIDDTFNKYKIFCFGIFEDSIQLNHLYVASIDSYNEFIGYSIFDAITKLVKM